MAMKQTQTIILGCMVISVANAGVANLTTSTSKSPSIKILIGGWVLTVGLLMASEAQPELAEAFAVLILMASLFGPNGTALTKMLTGLTSGKALASPVKGKESTLTNQQLEGLLTTGDANPSSLGPVAVARAVALKAGAIQPDLVKLSSGFLLDKDAAAAYVKAVEYYGKPIPIGNSYRTEAQQQEAYEKAGPNGTFGQNSLHTKGLAIDLDASAINLLDPKLYDALTRAGWYRRGKKIVQNGKLQPELWHYSFGVPG